MKKSRINRAKNRALTFSEYFEALQLEYIVAELRAMIYQNEKDKKYYREREMKGKKAIIIEISSRNNFPDIFNDQLTKVKYYSQVYNDWGLPNFIYRSLEDREIRRKTDIYNFFKVGTEVSVKLNDGTISRGIVSYVNIDKSIVGVKVGTNKIVPLSYDMISRMINYR